MHSVYFSSRGRTAGTQESRGFTLIELLVVIAIIGMLSSVILSSLSGARKKSRDARRITDLKQIQVALEMFFDSNATPEYPDALSSLAPSYIPTIPTDPATGSAYAFDNLASDGATACAVASGSCVSYILGATLEDATNPALAGDVDGTVGSVNCADANYCLRP